MKKILSFIMVFSFTSTSTLVSNASYKLDLVSNINSDVKVIMRQVPTKDVKVVSIEQLSQMDPKELDELFAAVDMETVVDDTSNLRASCSKYAETILSDSVVKKIMKRYRHGDKINQVQKRYLANLFYKAFFVESGGFNLKLNQQTILNLSDSLLLKELFVDLCIKDEETFQNLLLTLVKVYEGQMLALLQYMGSITTHNEKESKDDSFWDFLSTQPAPQTSLFPKCCCTLL